MSDLHIDFETYSSCDLKAEGLDRYAKDPSTGAHCLAYAFGDETLQVIANFKDGSVIDGLEIHLAEGGLIFAHNVAFELAIWNNVMVPRYGWPELKPEQCRCTLAMAYAMGLPGRLEHAAAALGIAERKDMVGARIMMKWCKPKKDGSFWKLEDSPEEFEKLCRYCAQDVEVERAMVKRMMALSPSEQELWTLDYQINQRGVRVDLPNIDLALGLVYQEQARLNKEMLRVTGGVVGSCGEVQLLVKWIRSQGVEIKGVAKADVLDALDGELPPQVRQALQLRKEAAKSSTAKLQAMKNRAGADGRVRGIHQFHGANTGRWAGRGIQVQNLPRPRAGNSPETVQDMISMFKNRDSLDMFHGPVLDALADCVRAMIVPAPGNEFICVDFSAIEARVLAWLAGEEHVLDAFRKKADIYKVAASRIYHTPVTEVTKDQRQIGKVAVLALGYGGGIGAFQSMARNYNVKVADAEADDIKKAWRSTHPRIVQYWYALESAAIRSLETGQVERAGPEGRAVSFRKSGSFLWCRLPSGRVLCYPYPELREVTTPWDEKKDALTYMTMVEGPGAKTLPDENAEGKWKRISTYGGSLAENLTQAVARDLLAEAMKRLEALGFQIVMHVHDEVVVEIHAKAPAETLGRVESVMVVSPTWASGLPIAAEGFRAGRYQK